MATETPLTLSSFPRAILHIDGDSFFASCEVAKDPKLRGKPVITGLERGIASAMTYEAKARGVKRGMRLSDIRRACPDAIILPSDYETYSLYSARMFAVVRRYTPVVEEYSIDECFAELTGLRRPLRMSYGEMARAVREELDGELGITFSVGLAPTKVLAKIASKWQKPAGLTIIPGNRAHLFLKELPAGKVWNIGPQTEAHLRTLGVRTALEFARKDEEWVIRHFTKPQREIWWELHGEAVYQLETAEKHDYASISKTKTFTPPSREREFVFAQLSKNIENACIKARRHGLAARCAVVYLKSQDFRCDAAECALSAASAIPGDIIRVIRPAFAGIFKEGTDYRATGVILTKLSEDRIIQPDLFGETLRLEKMRELYGTIDELAKKFGKHAVVLGSSLATFTTPQHEGERGTATVRARPAIRGETKRKHLAIPFLGEAG
ncbi:MAG TPA: DNA polymerase IV [Geobacteraceae bacterium]|nr:DNA polymerase IV [Geobacteraceae bacterium]